MQDPTHKIDSAHTCKGVVPDVKVAQGGVQVRPIGCGLEGKVAEGASQLVVFHIQHHQRLHIRQAGRQDTCTDAPNALQVPIS